MEAKYNLIHKDLKEFYISNEGNKLPTTHILADGSMYWWRIDTPMFPL